MSLTELILKNTKPWEKSLNWAESDVLNATLADSTGKWVRDANGNPITVKKEVLEQWIKDLNVGPNYIDSVLKPNLYPSPMTGQAQALRDAWIAAQAAILQHAATMAQWDPDAYSTPLPSDASQKKAAAWVAAVLTSPDPKTRAAVDGQAVTANALMFNPASDAPDGRGGQTVNGVLLITTAVDDAIVLYAPDAPDGQVFREVRHLNEIANLTRASAWQGYLAARLPANTRLLNPRLAPHANNLLSGLYRQNHMHLAQQVDDQTVSNEELERTSTTNKVWFGVEIALTALGADLGPGRLSSTAVKWIIQTGRIALQTVRKLGRTLPGLIVRQGFARRAMVETATASATLTGTARTSDISLRTLPYMLNVQASATTSMNPSILLGYQREFQRRAASLAVPGGIPAGSSLSEGSGIYRTPTSLLVRSPQASGDDIVLRIQDSFNLYDPNGVVARVLTPSGATTPFRLRKVAGTQRWALDTVERLPGGAPTVSKTDDAIRQWQTYYETFTAQNPGKTLEITPAMFFAERNILKGSWSKYVKQSGQLSDRGVNRLASETGARLNDDLFMEWINTPDKTPARAKTFQEAHQIRQTVWELYVQRNGEFTLNGLAKHSKIINTRITGKAKRSITDEHLKAWYNKFRDPANRNPTAVKLFAIDNSIHVPSWLRYVKSDGSFNPIVKHRLERLNIPVAEVIHPLPAPPTAPI
jgi:hypothetical protein